jgi:hypothetical protein
MIDFDMFAHAKENGVTVKSEIVCENGETYDPSMGAPTMVFRPHSLKFVISQGAESEQYFINHQLATELSQYEFREIMNKAYLKAFEKLNS